MTASLCCCVVAVAKRASAEAEMLNDRTPRYDPYAVRVGHREPTPVHELLACEAFELALGRRFVTIEHGEPPTIAESEALTSVYVSLRSMAQRADWSRARGTSSFISVAFGGRGADEFAAAARRLAESRNPGWWVISECPYPDAFD